MDKWAVNSMSEGRSISPLPRPPRPLSKWTGGQVDYGRQLKAQKGKETTAPSNGLWRTGSYQGSGKLVAHLGLADHENNSVDLPPETASLQNMGGPAHQAHTLHEQAPGRLVSHRPPSAGHAEDPRPGVDLPTPAGRKRGTRDPLVLPEVEVGVVAEVRWGVGGREGLAAAER